VIGEDLGTVPDDVREALAAADVLSYRVLLFERDARGDFKPPSEYPEAALAVASTHDLPTLAGWWEGRDIRLRCEHRLLPAGADEASAMTERVNDRGQLLAALQRAQLLPANTSLDPRSTPTLTTNLAAAVQRYLARTRAALAVVQPEDVFGVHDQANLPGTIDEHPNWRRKLPVTLDDASGFTEPLHALAAQLARERGRSIE
jgi:4-alpha-glucanotransferase